jgi:two-component system, OmpR family, response regulator
MDPVLLIEDDPDIRTLAEMSLRLDDVEVMSCASGSAGLAALETGRFSLVILDVMMPDMSGYDVLRCLRERLGDQAPPVALFTARPEDSLARELEGTAAVHVLPKPFEPLQLAKSVRALMRS